MSANREEILADFQACTGIEDVGEAIYILEENGWDLVRSVNKVMPQESFHATSGSDVEMVSEVIDIPASPVETATDMISVGNNVGHSQPRSLPILENNFSNVHQQPSTSSVRNTKLTRFNVQFGERIIPIDVADTGTVADMKVMLYRELKIPPCQQLLSGWARMAQYENTPIKNLQLPQENALYLTVKQSDGGLNADEDNEVTERLKGTYTLKIRNQSEDKEYNLKYPGCKTILEVKTDVYSLTNIHVRNQIWNGWPPNIDDQTVLALSGISYPEHELTLKQNAALNHAREKKQNNTLQIDSDDDEYEDASESFTVDDDYFIDSEVTKKVEPLIPEHIDDEVVGSISFSEHFTIRYGPIHPAFYQGTLEDALKEACSKPAKDRKILGIYLHHDSSVLSNVFCTQLLAVESVMQLVERYFVLWGWDLTYEANRTRLQNSVNNCLGTTAALSLRNIPVDKLPAIIIVMKIRSSTDIFSVVHGYGSMLVGNVGVNELLSSLIEAVDVFSEHQKVEVKEEQERAERELVKWEQDQAYRESLEADRAKEEAKRQLAEAESNERKRVEAEKAYKEAKKEAFRRKVEANLPPEPIMHQGDNITQIRFRLPEGKSLERKFLADTALKVLLDYLIVQGYPTKEYKVISSWPRRDLTALDSSKTLQELKLYPQETVILEER